LRAEKRDPSYSGTKVPPETDEILPHLGILRQKQQQKQQKQQKQKQKQKEEKGAERERTKKNEKDPAGRLANPSRK